jgi:hypothetical protein
VKGIVVVAALIVALMVVIKDGRVLQSAGLTGGCSHVSAASDGAEYEACKPGKLEGLPDLTKRGCKPAGTVGRVQYWSCPADVQPSDAGR